VTHARRAPAFNTLSAHGTQAQFDLDTVRSRREDKQWPNQLIQILEKARLMEVVERIDSNDRILAYIIRREMDPAKTTFVTPEQLSFQAGFIVYPANSEIARHVHKPIHRELNGTSEVLFVKKGRCEVDIFTNDKKLVATRDLRAGDVLMLISGGHGFRILEDTVFLEIKQGPYTGLDEKERF
jgi:hypothetical protein